MVMEYLDGETLAARIERHGRLTPGQIAPIARQFLTALASAHAAGIIHRDLKPENIFILRAKAGRVDFVKLIDFGISKFSRPFNEGEHPHDPRGRRARNPLLHVAGAGAGRPGD